MVLFPLWLVQTLIYGGLGMCAVGAAALLGMLIRDLNKRQIW